MPHFYMLLTRKSIKCSTFYYILPEKLTRFPDLLRAVNAAATDAHDLDNFSKMNK